MDRVEATGKAVAMLPHSINVEAPPIMRAVLRHILETGDVLGRDASGRVVLTLAVDEWLLDKLAAFGAAAEDLEPDEGT